MKQLIYLKIKLLTISKEGSHYGKQNDISRRRFQHSHDATYNSPDLRSLKTNMSSKKYRKLCYQTVSKLISWYRKMVEKRLKSLGHCLLKPFPITFPFYNKVGYEYFYLLYLLTTIFNLFNTSSHIRLVVGLLDMVFCLD